MKMYIDSRRDNYNSTHQTYTVIFFVYYEDNKVMQKLEEWWSCSLFQILNYIWGLKYS